MNGAAVDGTRRGVVRLDSLTGARFIAALGVFLYHATGIFPANGAFGRVLAFIGRDGAVGVDFFFVLSGFVLTWSWQPGSSVRAFYRRRFARIAPAYWVALIYGLLWVIWLYRDPLVASVKAIPAVFGLQAWFPDSSVHFAANGVEWSVSAELFFYALFPALILLARRRAGRIVLAVIAIALGAVAPVVAPAFLPADLVGWAIDVLPVVRLGEFAVGILLALWLKSGHRIPIRPWIAGVIVAACYLSSPVLPGWVPQRTMFLAAFVLAMAALAQADLAGRRTLLAARVPVKLGVWSYCFYLVHQMTSQIMLFICAKVVPGFALGPVWLLAAFGASVGLAALLYHFVEHPFERRLRSTRASGRSLPTVSATDHEPVTPAVERPATS